MITSPTATPHTTTAKPLETLTALVTGGGSGLGAATCRVLAEAGATVIVADIAADGVRRVVEDLRRADGDAHALDLDVRDAAAARRAIEGIDRDHGGLDVLINNAGVDETLPFDEIDLEAFDRVLDVNLRGAVVLSHVVYPGMKARGRGHIVNIVSTAARRAWPNATAYHASKWGLLGFSHALHTEARAHGVGVTALIVGGMRTPFILERFPETDPGVLQEPANVAEAVRWVLTQPEGTVVPRAHRAADARDVVAMSRAAVFLDKDGTLVRDIPYDVDPARIRLAPTAAAAVRRLHARGYPLFVVTNQGGVALGRFPLAALDAVATRLAELLEEAGARLSGFYACPHHPNGHVAPFAEPCTCRKPQPGLILRAAAEHDLDLAASWMVGDILDDVEAGARAGCRTALVDNGGETVWRRGPWREPDLVAPDLLSVARPHRSPSGHRGRPRMRPRHARHDPRDARGRGAGGRGGDARSLPPGRRRPALS